jgi:hypothetical protein
VQYALGLYCFVTVDEAGTAVITTTATAVITITGTITMAITTDIEATGNIMVTGTEVTVNCVTAASR